MSSPAQALEELAAELGVTRSYYDGFGRLRRASDDAVLAVVRALGAEVTRLEDAEPALRVLRERRARPAAPVLVCASEGEGRSIVLHDVRSLSRAGIVTESGERLTATCEALDGESARIGIPATLACGYHRLEVESGSRVVETRLVVAPRRLPAAVRGWGLFAPLYALRSEQCTPASYADLARLGSWMAGDRDSRGGHGAAYLGTLPLLACFFEEPFEPSPYSPISRAFWSEIYVDPRRAPEFDGTPRARDDRRQAGLIDYRGVMAARRREIEALVRVLDAAHAGLRRDEFENLLENDTELAQYAAFRAAVERHGSTWEHWAERARSGSLRAGVDYDGEAYRYHAYAQWLAREQLADAAASSPAGLFLDLPLGAHPGGYDTWRYREEFAPGISTGAPPDLVFEGGQDWGFPPLDPERSRKRGYACLRAALRHHFAHAALLRVDHVMGLHRLFWIPTGFSAADGVYVRSHAEDLWSILALEAARARAGAGAAVVGEDLGTVPDEVRAEMGSRGALRMHVVPFQLRHDDDRPLSDAATGSLACLGTHDMEPFAAWWSSASLPRDAIARFLGAPTSEAGAVLPALVAWLAASDADVVCANLEDFWLEHRRQNLPGTEAADVNWKRPFARSFEDFTHDPEVQHLVELLRQRTRQ